MTARPQPGATPRRAAATEGGSAPEAVARFCAQLERLAKTWDLYPNDQAQPVRRAAEELSALLAPAIGNESELVLHVRPNALVHTGPDAVEHLVYENADLTRSLASGLYLDGVRRLTFMAPLPAAEAVAFIQTLRAEASAHPEESLVSRLWAARFTSIGYQALEDYFADDAFQEDPFDPEAVKEAVKRSSRKGSSTLSLDRETLESLVGDIASADATEARKAAVFEVSPETLARLRMEADEPGAQRFARALEAIVLWIRQERSDEALSAGLATIPMLQRTLLARGDAQSAFQLVRSLLGLVDTLRFEGRTDRTHRLLGQVQALGRELEPRALVRGLTDPKAGEATILLVRALGESAIPAMAQALALQQSPESRALLRSLLKGPCTEHPQMLLDAVEREVPPTELLEWAVETGELRAVVRTLALENDPRPEVQELALTAMARRSHPDFTKRLMERIDAPVEATRVLALQGLAPVRDGAVAEKLARRIRARGFKKLALPEKEAHFRALGHVSGDKGAHILAALLELTGWFSRLDDDLRLLALSALGEIQTPAALAAVKEEAERSRKLDPVRTTAERIARELERKGVRLPEAVAARFASIRPVTAPAMPAISTFQLGPDPMTKLEKPAGAPVVFMQSGRFDADWGLPPPKLEDLLPEERTLLKQPADLSDGAKRRLLINARRVREMNHYERLGVNAASPADEIAAAYRFQASRFGPAKYAGKRLGVFAEPLQTIRQAIETAYRTLSDPPTRRAYDIELGRKGRGG